MSTSTHAKKCPALGYGIGCTCDGYHTFEELYEHRHALFIALCRNIEWSSNPTNPDDQKVWRAKYHSDGSQYDGWFILGINKEKGKQITYHIPLALWDSTDFATDLGRAPEYDGHTSDDVILRLK